MSQLVRLVYASRSTFTPGTTHQGLDPGIARILAKSRKNNARRSIVGGLLFGDGCFLQCLEGNDADVDALYERIRADPRHQDVTVLSRCPVVRTSFGAWSMKYAPGEEPLRRFMHGLGMNRFDPYAMSPENIEAAVAYMERDAESVTPLDNIGRPAFPERQSPASFIDTLKTAHSVVQKQSPAGERARVVNTVKSIIAILIAAAVLALGFWSRRG